MLADSRCLVKRILTEERKRYEGKEVHGLGPSKKLLKSVHVDDDLEYFRQKLIT